VAGPPLLRSVSFLLKVSDWGSEVATVHKTPEVQDHYSR
jgi:hypothetical protein